MKRIIFLIFAILASFAAGFIAASVMGNQAMINDFIAIRLGEYLDADRIFYERGDMDTGHIMKETPTTIMIKIDNNLFQIEKSKLKYIENDYNLRYLKRVL